MYTYLSVVKGSSPVIDELILPKIEKLWNRYGRFLEDDYSTCDFDDLLNKVSPHLYAGLCDGEFLGFVYLYEWRGGSGKFHSAAMTVCIEKKFWGKHAIEVSRKFIREIFRFYDLYKLKAFVFENNPYVVNYLMELGFRKEGVLAGETFKFGRAVNMSIYSVFNSIYVL